MTAPQPDPPSRPLMPTHPDLPGNVDWGVSDARLRSLAHAAVASALQHGTLIAQPCELCSKEPAEAHHDDYTEPLSVRWLCSRHHAHMHRKGGRPRKYGNDWVQTTVRLPRELHGAARIACLRRHVSLNDLVVGLLKTEVARAAVEAALKGDKP